jgi:predicted transposase YbfD/YdcC
MGENDIRKIAKFAQALERAMHYVVGNALVCLTSMKARDIVYESRRADKGWQPAPYSKSSIIACSLFCLLPTRRTVITLDGTCFRKSGLITGGLASIESKAARWNEKKLNGNYKIDDLFAATYFGHERLSHYRNEEKTRCCCERIGRANTCVTTLLLLKIPCKVVMICFSRRSAVDVDALAAVLASTETRLK